MAGLPDALEAAMREALRASEGVNTPAICVPSATCTDNDVTASRDHRQLTANIDLARYFIADSVRCRRLACATCATVISKGGAKHLRCRPP